MIATRGTSDTVSAQESATPVYRGVPTPDPDGVVLDAQSLEIARLIFQGELASDAIGQKVGLSGIAIRKIRAGHRRPAIKKHVERLAQEALEADRVAMMRNQRRAGQVLAELLESSDARVRLDAARTIRQEMKGLKIDVGTSTVTPADASRMFAERFHGHGRSNGD
jgi:hypothetical protein